VFGKGGWAIGIGGFMPPAMERHSGRARMVTRDFHRYYPMLRRAPITHDWAGPIDRTHNSLPIIDWLNRDRTIAVGVGWSGNGVGPSVVGGKMLAAMVLGHDDEWSNAGLVSAPARYFPPDPIRYVGAHLVREAIVRKERAEALEIRPGRISVALSNLAPSGLEDKS
jgi:glycine/D-amino acid oxidase-like deaminating enzyme